MICGRRPGKGVLRLESTVAVTHLKGPTARLPQTIVVSVLHDRQLRLPDPTRRLGAAPADLCKYLGGYSNQAFKGTCSWRNEGLRAPGIITDTAGVMQAFDCRRYASVCTATAMMYAGFTEYQTWLRLRQLDNSIIRRVTSDNRSRPLAFSPENSVHS